MISPVAALMRFSANSLDRCCEGLSPVNQPLAGVELPV